MKKIFVILLSGLFLVSCEEMVVTGSADGGSSGKALFDEKPQSNIDKTTLVGLWESNAIFDGLMNQKIRIRFYEQEEKVSMASECKYIDGTTLYVQAESEANFSASTVEVTETKQDHESITKENNKYECLVILQAGIYKMGISGKIVVDDFTLTKISNQ